MLASRTRRVIGRRSLIAAAGGLVASPGIARAQGQGAGVALVIGNSKYKWEASLPNVKRDAVDVAKRFLELGLKTELLQDVGRDAMRQAVDRFAVSARGANLAAFYFAGHGASWDKDTYLVPEDADLANPGTVQSLLPVSVVRDAVKEASHRMLVFDNCRNNPADGWRQRAALSLARIRAGDQVAALLKEPNTLVLYSTASGRTALDGPPGETSPFAAALLRQLDAVSVDLHALPSNLRRDLLLATQCRQLAWDQNTYTAPFILSRAGKQGASPAAPAPAAAAHDPTRIVDLKNVYAFARESGLGLPSGLIAYRAPDGSPHARKIGAYKYNARAPTGPWGSSIEPGLLVVMSVADDNSAEVIWATREWEVVKGAFWHFAKATLSGDRLAWLNIAETSHLEFKWQTNDSGIYQGQTDAQQRPTPIDNRPFTRLDG